MSASNDASRFSCPNCSAGMEFDPAASALHCSYCGTKLPVRRDASPSGVPELPYSDHAALTPIADGALEVTCSTCGATVQFTPPEVAGHCAFCAAKIVVQPKSADPLIAPQGVLPFRLTKQQASSSVSGWLRSRWFAPNGLKDVAKPDGLDGVYLPFWSFDARTVTDYRGERGEYYYVDQMVTVIENGRPVQRMQRVRKTRWHPASGTVETRFDDLLSPASRSVDAKRQSELEPWDLPALEAYEPGYLAGFKAQRYQIDLPQAFENAKQMMIPSIRADIREDIGGDEQRIHNTHTEYFDVTFRHLLLPVWIGSYRFQSKVYQITVNARTGEVQGDRPYSVIKILLLIVAIVVAILVLRALS